MIKTAILATVVAALGVGCGKKHTERSVAASWHKLGFPIDPEHVTIDPENPNTEREMVVIYKGSKTAQPTFDEYRTALTKAGYAMKASSQAPDGTWLEATLTKDGHDVSLHVDHASEGATVFAKREN